MARISTFIWTEIYFIPAIHPHLQCMSLAHSFWNDDLARDEMGKASLPKYSVLLIKIKRLIKAPCFFAFQGVIASSLALFTPSPIPGWAWPSLAPTSMKHLSYHEGCTGLNYLIRPNQKCFIHFCKKVFAVLSAQICIYYKILQYDSFQFRELNRVNQEPQECSPDLDEQYSTSDDPSPQVAKWLILHRRL